MTNDTSFEFRQVDILKRERCFELFEGRYIRVLQPRQKQDLEYTIDLLALTPKSSRHLRFSWKWLIGTCIALAVCAGATYFLFSNPNSGRATYIVPVLLIAIAAALGMTYRFFASSQRCQIFTSRFGKIPLVELLVNRPDRRRFRAFVKELELRIELSMQRATLSDNDLKAGEMRTLRRLAGQGIISTKAYDRVKATLLTRS